MNGATEAEKKEQPNDRKEEAETVKRGKEMEEKTIIQQKKHCAKGSESEYKETKDMKKCRRGFTGALLTQLTQFNLDKADPHGKKW